MIQALVIGAVKSIITQEVLKSVLKELLDATLIKKVVIIILEWLVEQTDNEVDDKLVQAVKAALKV